MWTILPELQIKAAQTSYEVEREGTWRNSFYESIYNIVPKLDKDTTKEN